jgi:hypothetical protein
VGSTVTVERMSLLLRERESEGGGGREKNDRAAVVR